MGKQNKHLDHLEDRIILNGYQGGKDAIALLKTMGSFLTGRPGPDVVVTTKWDGAPAVICGKNPENDKFFVGTKSVFNKKDPKICYTESDVHRLYDGALAAKLATALRFLPSSVTRGVLQGDMMFTDDKKFETIDGKQYITFRPNTITYAADPKTLLGRNIEGASIGIVFHTKYSGNTMADLSASFEISEGDFSTGGNVWAEKAEFKDISGVASMDGNERQKYDAYIRMAEGSLSQCRHMLDKIQSGKKPLHLDTEFLKFFNSYVRKGQNVPGVTKAYDDFLKHLSDEYDKASKGKTQPTQNKRANEWAAMTFFVIKNKVQFKFIIATFMNLQAAKNILVDKLKKVSKLRLFADRGGGDYVATTPEGFVAVTGGTATKLVDRLEFSKLNFLLPKIW